MRKTVTMVKEQYIDQVVRVELGMNVEQPADEAIAERIRFWQGRSSGERIAATWEITRRVHLARGYDPDDLKLKRSVTRLIHFDR